MNTGNWIPVRAIRNWRVWNEETKQYHRGTDGFVRVYVGSQGQAAAEHRAAKLNARKD